MILTDNEVLEEMEKGNIKIENFIKENLGPVSYDLTIDENIRVPFEKSLDVVDISSPNNIGKVVKIPYTLWIAQWAVFRTKEIIEVSNDITGIVIARSSLTKIPILFNIPGLVDPGYKGPISGVLYNFAATNLTIKPMRICQIVFHKHYPVDVSYRDRKLSKNYDPKGIESLFTKTDKEFREEKKESSGIGNLF